MNILLKSLVRAYQADIQKITSKRNKIPIVKSIGILLILALIQACTSGRNKSIKKWEAYEWQELSAKEGLFYKIHTRKVKESPFKEFKIKGVVRATPKEAVEALRYRIEHWKEFYTEDEAYFEVLESDSSKLLVYSVFKLPFPFRDRSMCERFIIEDDTVSGTTKISWGQEWEKAPSEKNIIRMPVATGSWTFEPHNGDSSMATYQVYTEPGGMLPGWMYNSTVQRGLPKELDAVESISGKLRKAQERSENPKHRMTEKSSEL